VAPVPPLPADFLFGVATADHQCEAFEERWEDARDRFDREMKLTQRDRATDFWNRYRDDVELARGLGCTAFRFSIAWARVEPEPGRFDDAALDHYSQLVDAIAGAGMEPIATLHHYTWPLHVESRGGMLAPDFPVWFEAYARAVTARFGMRVKLWITFNEPTELVYGYLKPWWDGEYRMPPGLPAGATSATQVESVKQLIRNLFQANRNARAVLRASNPAARVSANAFIFGFPAWLQRFLDWRTRRLKSPAAWERRVGNAGRRRLGELSGSQDLVIAMLTVTAERGRHVDFSTVYKVGSLAVLVPAGSAVEHAGQVRKVAAVAGSSAQSAAGDVLSKAVLLPVPGYDQGVAALVAGRADGLLGDRLVLDHLAEAAPGKFRLLADDLLPQRYAVAVGKATPGLLQVVNEVVGGKSATGAGQSAGLRRIRARGYLKAGVRGGLPGVSFRDPQSGEWSGSEIDLARRIAAAVFGDPTKVRFAEVTLDRRVDAIHPFARLIDPILRWFDLLLSVNNGNWWHLGIRGQLPEWLCPVDCVGQQDFVGLDYYWGISTLAIHRLGQLSDAAHGRFAQAPVWPGALSAILSYVHRLFPEQSILVVENGCVQSADGVERNDYIRRHVREVQKAVARHIPVFGYLCWSITSNREWGLAFSPGNDFGLYHIDLDGDPQLSRTRTSSADVYQRIIDRRGVDE
jgi:beta-glucosidase/6-phospho-beta-glucosidase/beta-galactosidase/ABC-type amino acid transport substrate-binding protein